MSETKSYKLIKVAVDFNVSKDTIAEFLSSKGYKIDAKNLNAKIGETEYSLLVKEFQGEKIAKQEAKHVAQITKEKKETIVLDESKKAARKKEDADDEIVIKDLSQSATSKALEQLREESKQRIAEDGSKKKTGKETPSQKEEVIKAKTDVKLDQPKVLSKIDLAAINTKTKPDKRSKKEVEEEEKVKKGKKNTEPVAEEVAPTVEAPVVSTEPKEDFLETKFTKLDGPKILGKVELPVEKKPSSDDFGYEKKKRKRIKKTGSLSQEEIKKVGTEQAQIARQKYKDRGTTHVQKRESKPALTDEEIQAQIKETLARLSQQGQKSKTAKYRREKREEIRERMAEEQEQIQADKSTLKVTEFVSANELAQMMSINVTQVIATCMQLGLFVSINQRLDAETISIVAEEFGYKVEFVSAEEQEVLDEETDKPEDLLPRPPVVTVMGHVDHGKTSLLDYVRKANVVAGEAGGITQHIGAYKVKLHDDKKITFLDTPGHEAFTAMRARGSKLADVAIIVVAADDSVMPQTKEAINHAQAANVPMVFAINKIDKPGAAPDKIREALAQMNILVEEWGGKFQCQEISAKQGVNIDLLLEKVLLEADMLQLNANPNKLASGAVIEATILLGRATSPNIRCAGISLNTGKLSPEAAQAEIEAAALRLGLPAADPLRGGPAFERLLDSCLG